MGCQNIGDIQERCTERRADIQNRNCSPPPSTYRLAMIYPPVERVIEAIDFNNGLAAVKSHFGFPRIGKICKQPRGHRIPSSGLHTIKT
ncbi:hypothetical protein NQ318_017372 [Aromia moschata]|uniref:Uncharacterized protein n=1 Tax=Aromia moschata TaxID=1265417 RepID=A0AAV8Z3R9_9CUCU|nr:hypothetical protein NQ318_017372 [Aromia moschata]